MILMKMCFYDLTSRVYRKLSKAGSKLTTDGIEVIHMQQKQISA